MITIHEKTAQIFDTLGLGALLPSSCVVTEELNGAYELELEHPYDEGGKWKRIEQERIIYASTPRGRQPFRIYNISPDMEGLVVNARHIFYDLLDNQSWAVSFTGTADSILSEWSKLLYTEMPFTFETDMTHEGAMKTGRMNPVQALLSDDDDMTSFVRGCGGEILRDHFNVSILAAMGQDRDVAIRYGKNLIGLEVTEDASDVKTRFLCYGPFDSFVSLDSPYIGNYVYPKIHTIEDGRKTIEALKAEAQKMLDGGADLPLVNIKVDFVELSKTVEYKDYAPLEQVFLGDTVTVINQKMNFSKKAKVISYEWNCLMDRYDEVELGDFMPSLAASVTSGARSGSVASSASATAASVAALLNSHMNDKDNPHEVTAKQTGGGSDGGSSLPEVSAADDGKVLMVDAGVWAAKGLEKYLGEYEVTPTTEAIVLSTYKLLMTGNVTVKAIPQSTLDAEYQKGYDEAFELYKPYKQELPYIESDGTQYLKTGVFHTPENSASLRMVLDVEILTLSGIALNGAASYQSFYLGVMGGTVCYATHYGDKNTGFAYTTPTRYVYDLDNPSHKFTLLSGENVVYETETEVNTDVIEGNKELYLFAYNSSYSGTVSGMFAQRLYGCKIYMQDKLLRDYIPVLDWDNVPCLYDKVTHKFYYNNGTGGFYYQKPVELPSGYTRLKYIQSSGTQWVNTGIVPSYGIEISMTYMVTTANSAIFGANWSEAGFFLIDWQGEVLMHSGGVITTVGASTVNAICSAKISTSAAIINGKTTPLPYHSANTTAYNIYLCMVGSLQNSGFAGKLRIYDCSIKNENGLVRDFVPCLNTNGIAGLYDLVEGKFYGNAGTGAFTYA